MNVVWIVIDCLRSDHMGCYGYGRPTTPNLDRVAREAVRFEQCISPHIPTQPAHTTMFSGRDVFAHQIVAQGGTQELDPSLRLLPDLLRERGYFTGAVDNIGRWFAPAFLLTVLVAAIIGFAGYAAVPAVGPGSYYPDAFAHPLGDLRGSSRRVTSARATRFCCGAQILRSG